MHFIAFYKFIIVFLYFLRVIGVCFDVVIQVPRFILIKNKKQKEKFQFLYGIYYFQVMSPTNNQWAN